MVDIVRNDLATRALEKALDGLSLRAQAISNNVANVDTPNFKTSEVTFERDLQAALNRRPEGLPLSRTDEQHIGGLMPISVDRVQPKAVPILNSTLRNDGNNVDVDREMSRLAETQLSFQATTQLLNVKFRQLMQAIWEGKK
ncbi:MAG: flagellar basal body rod protein FlgB [Chloroflexi bacterium]|nr:flagellar basal body rod protein FlgB [Chloroflexota bacterium]